MTDEEILQRGTRSEFEGRVREGRAWTYTETSGSQAQNARLELHVRAGAKRVVAHVHPSISQNGLLQVCEAPTLSASGTQRTPLNRNRGAKGEAPLAGIYYAPTVSASGTVLHSEYLPGGTGGANGYHGEREEDWILEPGSGYLFSLGNLAASAAIVSLGLNFFELTSGEV